MTTRARVHLLWKPVTLIHSNKSTGRNGSDANFHAWNWTMRLSAVRCSRLRHRRCRRDFVSCRMHWNRRSHSTQGRHTTTPARKWKKQSTRRMSRRAKKPRGRKTSRRGRSRTGHLQTEDARGRRRGGGSNGGGGGGGGRPPIVREARRQPQQHLHRLLQPSIAVLSVRHLRPFVAGHGESIICDPCVSSERLYAAPSIRPRARRTGGFS